LAGVKEVSKVLLFLSQAIEKISIHLAAGFAAKLFTTPIRHKIPQREVHFFDQTITNYIYVEKINKKVMVYRIGNGKEKVLLVHGWSGRASQLYKLAEELVACGFSVVSFDAPAHGKSSGRSTNMLDFIATIKAMHESVGPFTAAIGHSLGGMSLLHAASSGVKMNKLVTIGSGNLIQDIINEFTKKLHLSNQVGIVMRTKFEKRHGELMENYSSQEAAKLIEIPVLVVHDENDNEVPVSCAIEIQKKLKKGALLITKQLGHRKILRDQHVAQQIINFIKKQ
jgi:pimeloyl-ACP methyl ester carboxylesterase